MWSRWRNSGGMGVTARRGRQAINLVKMECVWPDLSLIIIVNYNCNEHINIKKLTVASRLTTLTTQGRASS